MGACRPLTASDSEGLGAVPPDESQRPQAAHHGGRPGGRRSSSQLAGAYPHLHVLLWDSTPSLVLLSPSPPSIPREAPIEKSSLAQVGIFVFI